MKNRRKFTRILLAPLDAPPIDEAFAVLTIDGQQIRRRIQNISYRGLGLVMAPNDDQRWLGRRQIPIAMEFEGVIARTEGEITFMGQGVIGVHFITLDDTSRRLVSAYIDPRFLATNLEEVKDSLLRLPNQRLFLGPNNTSLRLQFAGNDRLELLSAELVLLQGYLFAGPDGVKTGRFTGELMELSALTLDDEPNAQMIENTRRFIRHIRCEDELRLLLEMRCKR